MQNIKIDFINNTLIVGNEFYKNATIIGTPENAELNAAMEQYPNMKIAKRVVSRKKTTSKYKGITYKYMRKFITIMDNENLVTFERTIAHYENFYEEKSEVFAAVRDWFLAAYPKHKEMIVEETPALKVNPVVVQMAAVDKTLAAAG